MSKPIKNVKFSEPISSTRYFEKAYNSNSKTDRVAKASLSSSSYAGSYGFHMKDQSGDPIFANPDLVIASRSSSNAGSYGFHTKDEYGYPIFENPDHLKKK